MDIQFIQITPTELKELIRETIRREFIEFAKDFQPKEPTEYLTRKEVVKMLNINMSTLHHRAVLFIETAGYRTAKIGVMSTAWGVS